MPYFEIKEKDNGMFSLKVKGTVVFAFYDFTLSKEDLAQLYDEVRKYMGMSEE